MIPILIHVLKIAVCKAYQLLTISISTILQSCGGVAVKHLLLEKKFGGSKPPCKYS